MVLLSGCPQQCAPAPGPPAAVAPPAPPPPPPPAPPAPVTPGGQFTATFETAGDFVNRFVTWVGNDPHPSTNDGITSFPGDHDAGCSGPDQQRTVHVTNPAELYWWCAPGNDAAKGHVMTALDTLNYGIVSFSPNQQFSNVSRVCWDLNETDLGGGKWANVILVPEATYRANAPRLDYVTAGFNTDGGPGDFNLQGFDVFGVKVFRGTMMLFRGDTTLFQSQDTFTTGTDRASRFQHCMIDNGNGTITLSQDRPGGRVSYTARGSFPDGVVRVIFQDDNYNTVKHDGIAGFKTWHWDNITIS
jgi:hypothetical protein